MKSFSETMAAIFYWIAIAAGGGGSRWGMYQTKEPPEIKIIRSKMKSKNKISGS